jgi:phosphohistidine phosphatase SixA
VLPRRTLLASLLAAPALDAAPSVAAADPLVALRLGDHVAVMRHATAPGGGDPPGLRLDDCATQRNLSEEGRTQAVRVGDRFRAAGTGAAQVFSSQWCRCLDTAGLLRLGAVEPLPLLNSFFGAREREAETIAGLRRWIAARDLSTPTILVTHQVTIAALCGVFPASGEVVVLRRAPDSALAVHGRSGSI